VHFKTTVALLFLSLVSSAQAEQRCDKPTKSGVKRCEASFTDKKTGKDWKTITYFDRRGDLVDFEANFPKDVDQLFPIVMIGATMAITNPSSTPEQRKGLLDRLAVNAGKTSSEYIDDGRYQWTSVRMGTTYIFRAVRKK
jgi:hypothetical protein